MGEKNPPSFEELMRMRVVFSVPGMDAINVRRNVAYKTADGEPLSMDLYSPPGSTQPAPVVILVHGGPVPMLGAKNMGVFVSYGELLAASGFVAVAFNHRFLGMSRLPDAAADLADAIMHIRTNAASFAVDPGRLAMWVFSGAGPLVAAPLRERPAWLRAIVAYFSVLDLQQPPPGAERDISAELGRDFSAIRGLGDAHTAPPILVARAGLDNPWLNGTIDRFVQTATSAGATLDLLNHPEGRHAFDILDDDQRSKQIIRNTLHFLRDNLS
jgi:acetyl esterase/lipase